MIGSLLAVALGGAIGASIRFGVNQLMLNVFHAPLFFGTLLVNVVGCFVMGLSYHYLLNHGGISDASKLFVTVGLLGALTTWSTFSMETVLMIQNDQLLRAVSYTLITTVCCFTAFWFGVKS
ncbi:MAG: fluoride efflux transporter CrcB [Marinicella sp.]